MTEPPIPPRPSSQPGGGSGARPRIRPAQSQRWERSDTEPTARPRAAAPAAPAAGVAGAAAAPHRELGYWSGPHGQLYYRAADGQDYYQASDGKFYPVAALIAAQQAGSAGAPAYGARSPETHPGSADSTVPSGPSPAAGLPGSAAPEAVAGSGSDSPAPGASAADDRSTYYEYIAARTGEHPLPNSGLQPAVPAPAGSHTAQAARPRRRRTALTVFAALAATALVAVTVFIGVPLFNPSEELQPSAEPVPGDGSDPGADGGSDPSGGSGAGGPESEKEAAERLKGYAEASNAVATNRLDGHWVVQLSAKQPGLKTEHRTWTNTDILKEFESLQAKHSDAALLNSSQWSSFRLDGYWITVLATPYDSPEPALKKCRELKLGRDSCFAKKISSTDGPEGTTKLNP